MGRERLSGEWLDWCQTKDRIGQQLREYYHAPRLLDVLKKLDEETENSAEQFEVVRPSRSDRK